MEEDSRWFVSGILTLPGRFGGLPGQQEARTISTYMKRKIPVVLIVSVAIITIIVAAGIYFWLRSTSMMRTKMNSSNSNVHLTNYTDNDGTQSTVVLSGAIGDFGQAVRSNDRQSIMTLHLSHGTFQLDITNLAKHFTTATGKAAFNQTTCSGNVSVDDPAPIITGSGTGAYSGISGNFSLSMNLDEVVPTQQGCSANSKMLSQAIVTSGWGNVSL